MIKAVIFDCFGVLVTEAWEPFCYEYFKDDKQKMEEAHSFAGQFNSGIIDYETFIQNVAKLAKITPSNARNYIDENKQNLPLFDYMEQELKPKYKIGMLSNAGDNWLNEMFSQKQLSLFDDAVLSYEFGITKPQKEIYELAAQRLDVGADECVFIDDLEKHVTGAGDAGMQAVLYQNFAQMKAGLEKILSTS